ncbi:probable tyrosyl-DNA phosphodiesterase isoform X2 [Phymastichus coffea]|uniref:probable tyrosyl-DNA phosphodiesterase isoform X2 n=1 Tax=Phymastichus coffea TaxID=108790 RepID=UPI00273A9C08|nr:probable tyrosyl-DNA phosphodiesterase isoform X2 [Phymastichus coffea]
MNNIINSNNVGEKKLCPYKDKCYRKNPIHFNEMSHPHLEKLILNQLDEAITIPRDLEFECTDRIQLLDQLKVLQMVLRKERDKNDGSASLSKATISVTLKKEPQRDKNLDDWKAKIFKHKQDTEQKRQNKLKDMDLKAMIPDDNSCTNKKRILSTDSEQSTTKKYKNESILKEKSDDSMSFSFSSTNSQSSSSQSSSQSSLSGRSFIESFISSTDTLAKEKVRTQAIDRMRKSGYVVNLVTPGEFALKYALSAPYHYFFNRVEKSKVTHEQQFTVSFPELLDVSLGEIVNSLHINFMVELGWLCLQYLLAAQTAKMTIFYGELCDPQTSLPPNINLIQVKLPTAYGCHHSKVSIIKYNDGGIRIIVSTANLYSDDWDNRTQGLWMSPHLPQLPDSANPSDGESPTNFKKSFREYLAAYHNPKLVEWEHLVKKADFSSVNVFFIASVPGSHKGRSLNSWGHRRLAAILNDHAVLPADAPQWTLVAQSSSIGVLGPNFDSWIGSNIVFSMSREKVKELVLPVSHIQEKVMKNRSG